MISAACVKLAITWEDTTEYMLATMCSCLEVRRNFFGQRVVRPCNQLPHHVFEAPTVDTFKRRCDVLKRGMPYGFCIRQSTSYKYTASSCLNGWLGKRGIYGTAAVHQAILLVCSIINKNLSYRRGTARCVVSIEILRIATLRCRNYIYLYDKSWPNRWYEVGDLVGGNEW